MPEMENRILEILHAEDNPTDAGLISATLKEAGLLCEVLVVKSRSEFERAVKNRKFDVILSDFSFPSFSGKEAFQIARECTPETPFVFVSGTLGEDAAIQCLIDGATDYVLKTKMARLVPAVRRSVKEADARKRLKLAEKLREKALEELRISEARFRGVLECAPDSALIVDSAGMIAFANPQAERMFGFSRHELIGKPLEVLVPDRYKKLHRGQVDQYNIRPHPRALSSGFELIGRRRDGSEFPADIMLSPLSIDHDMSVLAMIRDVTTSKRAEKALRDSEEQFRTIYEASPVAILSVDSDGNVMKCNLAATKLLGYTEMEIQNMQFDEFTHKDDREIGLSMMEELQAGRSEVVKFETRYVRRNDETIRVHLTVSAVRDEDGKFQNAIVIIEDITEKWQAEEALRRSEERYRSLVDSARDAIYTLSPNATIMSLNPAFETLTGWKREDWLGKTFGDLIHPDDRRKAVDSFQRTVSGELVDVIQYKVLKKSGEYTIGEFSTTKLVLEDGSVGILGIARDVTSQIALEEQLRQSQKMESLGTLAGGIAHDFNNILGIIIGYAGLIQQALKDDKKLSRNVQSIESASQRGVNLVRQLLTFARKQERILQPVSVNEVVTDIYRMISETFPKVISVRFNANRESLLVYGDQTEIHQAVLNLCVNARDAMMNRADGKRSGGTLMLSTGVVLGIEIKPKHPSATDEEYIRVTVSDTGIGMDEATQARVFEPFFTTKEIGKGTGLGLSTVYGIINAHGGYIESSSEPGGGTTFTVFLPSRKQTRKLTKHDKSQTEVTPDGCETVLVVEDETELRDLLFDVLTERGYKVLTAEDGQRALAVFLNHRDIDLVITDIGLPKVGGLDLYKAIKKLKREIKVVMVSGFVNESDREEMLKGGVDEFIQKPYKPVDVLRRVRDILDRG